MNALIDSIFEARMVTDAEGNSYPLDSSISREDGVWLTSLMQERRADRTLEVGMAHGLSSLHFCEAHRRKGFGHHTAIDPLEKKAWHSIGLLNLERAGLSGNFRLLETGSERALPELLGRGEKFDYILIDGLHQFDYTLMEFFYADKLLNLNGLVMFHDIWMPAIRKVISYILRNHAAYREVRPPAGRNSLFRRTWRFCKNLRNHPLDPAAAGVLIDGRIVNCCVLEKTGEDSRRWTFYRSF